jgi:hypothetical protein
VRHSSEVLDVGSGQVDVIEEAPDHSLPVGFIELDVGVPAGPTVEYRQPAQPSLWPSYSWRIWAVLAVAFLLGVSAAGISSGADGQAAPEVIAGQAAVNGVAERVTAKTGTVPIVVSLFAAAHDVEVVSVRPTGWPRVDSDPESQIVSAGQWHNVAAVVRLDCRAPEPAAAHVLEAHVRMAEVERTSDLPLPGGVAGLGEAWREFCPAPTRPPRGLIP